jgi:hypothetical protein
MQFAKRLLMGVGAVALTAMLVSLGAPKAVHAVVAALVQVTNTNSNPVPTADVYRSASQLVELTCLNGAPYPCVLIPPSGELNLTSPTAWTVPPGMNFVVTDVQINTELEMDNVTGTYFTVTWTPPGSMQARGVGWSVTDNGESTEFQLSSGVVAVSGSEITGQFGPDVVGALVHGYLTPY